MSLPAAQAISVIDQHLEPREVAAYVDGATSDEARSRIQSHIATCAECRAEVSDAARIIATLPRARSSRWRAAIPAAAVAATLLFFFWPRGTKDSAVPQHRESAVTTTIAPVIVSPIGVVNTAHVFTWASVPHASTYAVRVFDPDGSVVWQRETPDTVLPAPSADTLKAGRSYYWKVEARTGFERSASTDLVEFSIRAKRSP